MVERYRINHLPRGSAPRESLVSTPIPGEARVPMAKSEFAKFAAGIGKEAEDLGGRVAVFLNEIAPFNYSSAIISWRQVSPDNLGSRFVKMEGLEKDIFELETLPCRFLLEALEHGAHLKLPRIIGKKGERGPTQQQWERRLKITILNFFGKVEGDDALSQGFSYEDIGKIDPERSITRERVRQLVNKTISQLHANLPDYLKHKYSLRELLEQIEKPQVMTDKAGTSRKIAEAVLKGANYEDLRKEHSISRLQEARNVLSEYNLEVPYDPERIKYQILAEDLGTVQPDDSKDKKQEFLERATRSFKRGFPEEFKTYYLTVSELAKELDLHFGRHKGGINLVLQSLSEVGINLRTMTQILGSGKNQGLIRHYYIILAVDREKALKTLQNDLRLEPLRRAVVKQVFGQKVDQLPTTWELAEGNKYRSVGSLVNQLGKRTGRWLNIEQLLEGCLMPVFKISKGYYYPAEMSGQMEEFLRSKLAKTYEEVDPDI